MSVYPSAPAARSISTFHYLRQREEINFWKTKMCYHTWFCYVHLHMTLPGGLPPARSIKYSLIMAFRYT
ncbi:hypothetical protein M378DRAFT_19052 [Amanita muscaria Koide BX008]|uniref:Uncharacterized protein n=1 Tax=Amanita muscaria (strain Koide BX008) TaxID=946122 RepID=A0A0C2VZK7_AMAMK|nr:hypothetical protein M378DRAFT_19052 [Amanita muscaria Koide BX008]